MTDATLRDTLLPILHRTRGIMGRLGFRRSKVWIVETRWSGGEFVGEGNEVEKLTPILEDSGSNPNVVELSDRRLMVYEIAAGSVEIGPITPRFGTFVQGGVDIDQLRGKHLGKQDQLKIRIEGEKGTNDFTIHRLLTDNPLAVMVIAAPLSKTRE